VEAFSWFPGESLWPCVSSQGGDGVSGVGAVVVVLVLVVVVVVEVVPAVAVVVVAVVVVVVATGCAGDGGDVGAGGGVGPVWAAGSGAVGDGVPGWVVMVVAAGIAAGACRWAGGGAGGCSCLGVFGPGGPSCFAGGSCFGCGSCFAAVCAGCFGGEEGP
jgi:hypothetical protein